METSERPVVRVVRGDPTDEELAAVLAVILRAGGSPASPPQRYSHWLASARPGAVVAGLPAARGRHGWRTSALPR